MVDPAVDILSRQMLESRGFGCLYEYPEGDLFEFYGKMKEFELRAGIISLDEYFEKKISPFGYTKIKKTGELKK